MSRTLTIGLGFSIFAFSTVVANTESQISCPVTIGSDHTLSSPFDDSTSWYGSESLAVVLPPEGKWGVTGPTSRIAVKLFLWGLGFEPGMEKHLSVEIASMTSREVDAVVKDITNARPIDGDSSAMLVGIDFPSAGCWRITAEYLGQSLTFIAETVDPGVTLPTSR